MPEVEEGSLLDLATMKGILPTSVVADLHASVSRAGHFNARAEAPHSDEEIHPSVTLHDSGVDFSYTISPGTASCLKANRGGFVCVYTKWTGRGSIEAYRAAGLRVVPIYETSGVDYRGGYPAGQAAAGAHNAWCAANGYPNAEVYFTFDTDVMGAGQEGLALAYCQGWNSVVGLSRSNGYGSSGLITYLLNAKAINRGWVTYAWSGGALDERATLYQNPNSTTWCGVSTDNDRAFQPVIGAIGESPAPAPPPPPPADSLLILS